MRRKKPLFVRYCAADFLSGVVSLSPQAELAYRRICDMIYNSDDQLLDDDRKMPHATKVGRAWKRVKQELIDEDKIKIDAGRIRVDRCIKELALTHELREQKSRAGVKSGESRKSLKSNTSESTNVQLPFDDSKSLKSQGTESTLVALGSLDSNDLSEFCDF